MKSGNVRKHPSLMYLLSDRCMKAATEKSSQINDFYW